MNHRRTNERTTGWRTAAVPLPIRVFIEVNDILITVVGDVMFSDDRQEAQGACAGSDLVDRIWRADPLHGPVLVVPYRTILYVH